MNAAANTDRELYREDKGDPAGSYYENSVFVTADGRIGMNVGGRVIVQEIADWQEDARWRLTPAASLRDKMKRLRDQVADLSAHLDEKCARIHDLEQGHEMTLNGLRNAGEVITALSAQRDAALALHGPCDLTYCENCEAYSLPVDPVVLLRDCHTCDVLAPCPTARALGITE